MRSMTGYGVASTSTSALMLEASVKAVNGRFLDIRFHLPREYTELESDIKKVIQEKISRGTVDIFISRRQGDKVARQVKVSVSSAKEWVKAYNKLAKELKIKDRPTMQEVLACPDVIRFENEIVEIKREKKQVLDVVRKALAKCDEEKLREGLALRKELLSLIKVLNQLVELMRKRRIEANAELEEKYKAKINKLAVSAQVDSQRIAQEIVFQLDKSDINEEVSRLGEHLRMFYQIVEEKTGQGKKLDFYTQELLREVNTIGSKSNLADLTQAVVEAKTVVEKIRELVQNIE